MMDWEAVALGARIAVAYRRGAWAEVLARRVVAVVTSKDKNNNNNNNKIALVPPEANAEEARRALARLEASRAALEAFRRAPQKSDNDEAARRAMEEAYDAKYRKLDLRAALAKERARTTDLQRRLSRLLLLEEDGNIGDAENANFRARIREQLRTTDALLLKMYKRQLE